MKHQVLYGAVLAALASAGYANATGFVVVPPTGFGASAYSICNDTGNFGSDTSLEPKSTGSTRVCATFPNNGTTDAAKNPAAGVAVSTPYGSTSTTPVVGFTLQNLGGGTSKTTNIVLNNSATGNTNKTVATVTQWIWADAAGTSCIYGARFDMSYQDGKPTSDPARLIDGNYWEVNDFARAGFANFTTAGSDPTAAGAVSIAYWRTSITDEVNFRIGRTYSAVQHHDPSGSLLPAGVDLPGTTAPSPGAPQSAIVAVPSSAGTVSPWLGYPIGVTQTAAPSANWLDFTTDVNAEDPDGSTFPDSSMMYVRVNKTAGGASGCPTKIAGFYAQTPNAIRLRSTGQEDQILIEASVAGYAPSGGNVNP